MTDPITPKRRPIDETTAQPTCPTREAPEAANEQDTCVSSIASAPNTSPLYPPGAVTSLDASAVGSRVARHGAVSVQCKNGKEGKKEDKEEVPPPSSLEDPKLGTQVTPQNQQEPFQAVVTLVDPPGTLPRRQVTTASNTRSQPGAYLVRPGEGLLRRFGVLISHIGIGHHEEESQPETAAHQEAPTFQDLERQETNGGLVSATPVPGHPSAEPIAHAEQVDASQLKQQVHKEQKERHCQRSMYGILAISLALLVVGLGLGLGLNKPKEARTKIAPTVSPSAMSSSAPTTAVDLLLQDLPESTLENIYITGTPQQQAFTWLLNHPNIASLRGWKIKQLFALVAFYYAFGGPNWPEAIQGSWLDYTQDECSWINTPLELMYGLSAEYTRSTDFDFRQCNDAGQVQTIWLLQLQLSNAHAFLPPEISLLSSLKVVSLMSSGFRASLSEDMIPALALLPYLQALVIADNSLSGTVPTEIALLSDLRHLLLTDNQLTGTIPSEVGKMSQLEQLWISVNSLSGAIPSQLGALTRIWDIDLDLNSLSGMIPSELGGLSSLALLRLVDNSLSGSIPKELTRLSSLEYLVLPQNILSGTIPTEVGWMNELRDLALRANSFSGTIPSQLGMASNMNNIGLATNHFSGSIPTEIQMMSSLSALTMEINSLSGPIPTELGLLTQLTWLNLQTNNLQGPLPSELRMLNSLHHLHLGGNALTGFIPQELGFLITNASLESMTLQNNDLSGTVSDELCLLQKFNPVPGSPGIGLSFDCNEKLCGCHWCGCSGTGIVASNETGR